DGLYKSVDCGRTWTHLGLRDTKMIAMIDVDPRDPNRLFVAALGHPYGPNAEHGIFGATHGGRAVAEVLCQDEDAGRKAGRIDPADAAGEHWRLVTPNTRDPRPLARIGGGDLPTIAVDPKDPNVVYSASTVMWRTEDAGATWSAVRGAPGGDDYQKIWINP